MTTTTETRPVRAPRRRKWRGKIRPALMAFSVLMLSLSLIIQTGRPAEAFQPPIDVGNLAKGALKGAKVGGPASLFGKFTNPWGLAITAGAIAWGAWSTRDTWMGIDDPGVDTSTITTGWGPSGSDSSKSVTVVSVSGRTATFELKCTQGRLVQNVNYCKLGGVGFATHTAANTDMITSQKVECKNAAGVNVLRDFGAVSGTQAIAMNITQGATLPATQTATYNLCPVGETVVGFAVPPRSISTNTNGNWQSFGIAWGTQLQGIPPGTITFGRYKIVVGCKNNTTGETTTITSRTDAGQGGIAMPSCVERFGPEWHMNTITITPEAPEIEGEPLPEEWDVPDFPPLEWDELIPEDPDWMPCYGEPNGCSLGVWIDDVPCKVGVDICKKWTKVLEKEPTRVRCTYGTRVVPDRYCLPLAAWYDPDVDTHVNTDAPPTTKPDTGTGTDTATDQATDVVAKPNEPMKDPADETKKGECFPKGWGMLNPVEWVYKPVKCALEWGFKPTTPFSTRMQRMKTSLETRAPFKWMVSLGSLPTAIPGGGCPNWVLKTPDGQSRNIICGTGFGNAMHGARPIWAVLMVGAAFYPLIRSVMYASFPLVKPSPTSA